MYRIIVELTRRKKLITDTDLITGVKLILYTRIETIIPRGIKWKRMKRPW